MVLIDPTAHGSTRPLALEHEAEIALAKQLLRFADAVYDAAAGSLPHLLCEHLYALARHFSVFFEQCPVLKADNTATRESRLALCAATLRVLTTGLGLLGVPLPERM